MGVPVLSDAQVAALAMGAHPFRVVQFHWHSTDWRPFLEKLNIPWQKYWDEFQGDLDQIRAGTKSGITWQDADMPIKLQSI